MVVLTGCWVHGPALCTVSRGSPTSPRMFVSVAPVISHAHLACENAAYHSSVQLSKKRKKKRKNPQRCDLCTEVRTIWQGKQSCSVAAADMKLCSELWFCFRWMSDRVNFLLVQRSFLMQSWIFLFWRFNRQSFILIRAVDELRLWVYRNDE